MISLILSHRLTCCYALRASGEVSRETSQRLGGCQLPVILGQRAAGWATTASLLLFAEDFFNSPTDLLLINAIIVCHHAHVCVPACPPPVRLSSAAVVQPIPVFLHHGPLQEDLDRGRGRHAAPQPPAQHQRYIHAVIDELMKKYLVVLSYLFYCLFVSAINQLINQSLWFDISIIISTILSPPNKIT